MYGLRALLTAMCVAGTAFVAGCSDDSVCLPALASASPSVVHPGQAVTISAPPADCGRVDGPAATYGLTLISNQQPSYTHQHFEADAASNGSFSIELRLVEGFPAGPASVVIDGSAFDSCADTSSCAAYQVSFSVAE